MLAMRSASLVVVALVAGGCGSVNTGAGGAGGAGTSTSSGAAVSSTSSSTSSGGGCGDVTSSDLNCGACGYACVHGRTCVAGACTPAWQPLATAGAPAARDRHAAVGLGHVYIATGGTKSYQGTAVADAVGYDLDTDTWGTFPSHAEARLSHSLVRAGNDVYAFGGITDASDGTTIGPGLERLSGATWTPLHPSGAPHGRYNFAMTWTGTDLMIYGGGDEAAPAVATGARLVPGSDWTDASCPLTGCERGGYYALFVDGPVLHLFGGGPYGSAPAGLEYDPTAGTWASWVTPPGTPGVSELPKQPADDGRRIFWVKEGASCDAPPSILSYDRKTESWSIDTTTPPAGLVARGAVAWVGRELVVWSGICEGTAGSVVGGRYEPPAPAP
jgi:hypothetical protein